MPLIDIAKLNPGKGRRIDKDTVEWLAHSIEEIGLLHPLLVKQNGRGVYDILAGRHRYSACKQLGKSKVRCTVLDTDDLRSELVTIDENLIRIELSGKEAGDLMLRRKRIYIELYPDTEKGKAQGEGNKRRARNLGGQNDREDKRDSFVKDTAKKTGKSESTIRRSIARAEKRERGEDPTPPKRKRKRKRIEVEVNYDDLENTYEALLNELNQLVQRFRHLANSSIREALDNALKHNPKRKS